MWAIELFANDRKPPIVGSEKRKGKEYGKIGYQRMLVRRGDVKQQEPGEGKIVTKIEYMLYKYWYAKNETK